MNLQEAKELFVFYNTSVDIRELPESIALEQEYELKVIAMCKELTGKNSKKFSAAFDKLVKAGFTDNIKALIKFYEPKATEIYTKVENEKEEKRNKLIEFAKDYIPTPKEMQEVKVISGGNYHTQGFGANKYARNTLVLDSFLLTTLGYIAEIKVKDSYNSGGMYPMTYETYQLIANIDEFDFWCLDHSGNFLSVLNWAVICWRNGSNPKVYFPFLSDNDYEKSLALLHKDYKITKENMMLEPSWDEIKAMK